MSKAKDTHALDSPFDALHMPHRRARHGVLGKARMHCTGVLQIVRPAAQEMVGRDEISDLYLAAGTYRLVGIDVTSAASADNPSETKQRGACEFETCDTLAANITASRTLAF